MACQQNLVPFVIAEAGRQGVDASVALAVARRESGVCQWNADGSVKRGGAGEIGVMQLMAATASVLGVDPFDPQDNIRGGIRYLGEQYSRFGNWALATAAYNWGPGKVARAIANRTGFPSSVTAYARAVTGQNLATTAAPIEIAGGFGGGPQAMNWAPVAILGAALVTGVILVTN